MKKRYVCSRYPRLKLLGGIHFQNGFFETDNIKHQRRIESNDLFGGCLREVNVAEIEEVIRKSKEEAAPKPEVNIADLFPVEESSDFDDLVADEVAAEEGGESPLPHSYLTATDISRMNKADLVEVAKDINVCLPPEEELIDLTKNAVLLKAEVKRKLGK